MHNLSNPPHDCCDNCALDCHCLCVCASVCTCKVFCTAVESTILRTIRTSIAAQVMDEESGSSENEEFSSDSDIEEYIRRQPRVIESSDESD